MRFAVIGLGIGRVHAQVLAEMPDVELVGVCDLLADAANEVAAATNTRAFTDWEAMVTEAKPDAVCLCTNPKTHLPIGAGLAQRGVHVLCEKPMAPSVEQCIALTEACEQAGVALLVGQKKRFAPGIRFLKEHINGDFGKPLSLNYRYHPGQVPKDWFWAEDDGGGPLLENSIHCFDTLRFVIGEIKSIRGLGGNLLVKEYAPQVDIALGLIEFENGCVGAVELGTATEWCVADEEFYVACDKAVVRSRGSFDQPSEILYVYRAEQVPRTYEVDYSGNAGARDFEAEIRGLMRSAQTGEAPLVPGREAAKSVACCLALKRAVREGSTVDL